MAKKQSEDQQHQKFLEKVQEMVDAGELSPTEAEEKFDRAMERLVRKAPSSPSSQ